MGISRSKRVGVVGILFCSLFLISCKDNTEVVEKVEGIALNKGAVIENEGWKYSNYNYVGSEYKKIEEEDVIGLYDYKSGNYIAQEESNYIAFYSGKIVELSNIEIGDEGLNISPGGKYLSLYRDIEGIRTYKVIKLEDGAYVDFEPKVAISGEYLDWLDEDTLVYYGVSEDGVNGIFTYSINEGKESLLYKIEGGIVQFLKSNEEGTVILQENVNDERILQVISNTGDVKTISSKVTRIYDVVFNGEYYYLLGEFSDNGLSIYRLKDGKHERLIFDFPRSIKATKQGLSLDEEGNILFIGSNGDPKLEEVYRISKDGTIRKISESKEEFSFVK